MDTLEIEPNFEPQTRARSNTWPLPRPENYVDKDNEDKSVGLQNMGGVVDPSLVPKKNSSRRNAWGNMSYADLISQAINSAPEKRLTLSQIYEWMVQNVPYFKDKGDSNSSAGWKNSIRHNLSLHNRFMRVQNEGTGKSSWWMINPDAKPGKAARRRAASMETKAYEKKRGRVKKKVEALRNGLTTTPSPSSSVSEGLDVFPESPVHHGFQLSPDFRPRASSNASSCSRLSPIPAVETDMHDNQAPPLSPIPWNSELGNSNGLGSLYGTSSGGGLDGFTTDQLVDSLHETMKLNQDTAYLADMGLKMSPPSTTLPPMGGNSNYTLSSFNSVYGSRTNGKFSSFQSDASGSLTPINSNQPQQRSPQHILSESINGNGSYNLSTLQTLSPSGPSSLSPGHSLDTLSPPNQTVSQNSAYNSQAQPVSRPTAPQATSAPQPAPSVAPPPPQPPSLQQCGSSIGGFCHQPPSSTTSLQQSRATALLNREVQARFQAAKEALAQSSMAPNSLASASLGTTASHVVNQLLSLNNSTIPNDLDMMNFEALQGGLECDVDQVIRHELSVDGNLDFNFDPMNTMNSSVTTPRNSTVTTARGNRPWVH